LIESTIEEILIKFINENFVKESGTVLDSNGSLLEKGLIDSTGVLELMAFIEVTFKIRVEDEEIIPDNFDSISKLVCFIRAKLAK
jgi:acyl carrier protein